MADGPDTSDRPALSPSAIATKAMLARIERNAGRLMFAARWIMAPIYVGLLAAMVLLAAKFVQKLVTAAVHLLAMSGNQTALAVLQLVDLALLANLVLIVMLAGWENAIGPLMSNRRSRFAALSFGAVKLNLVATLTAIAAIDTLETFMNVESVAAAAVIWRIAILLAIGGVGVLLALTDRLSGEH